MKIYNFLISNPAALLMFLIIQTAQAFHTSFVLYKITPLPHAAALTYSILAAIGIELIIVCLIGRGRVATAKYYKWFYFLMNVFAYHLSEGIYFVDVARYVEGFPFLTCLSGVGFFVLIPAYFLPLAGEELAKELTKEDPSKSKRKRRTNAQIAQDVSQTKSTRPPKTKPVPNPIPRQSPLEGKRVHISSEGAVIE